MENRRGVWNSLPSGCGLSGILPTSHKPSRVASISLIWSVTPRPSLCHVTAPAARGAIGRSEGSRASRGRPFPSAPICLWWSGHAAGSMQHSRQVVSHRQQSLGSGWLLRALLRLRCHIQRPAEVGTGKVPHDPLHEGICHRDGGRRRLHYWRAP